MRIAIRRWMLMVLAASLVIFQVSFLAFPLSANAVAISQSSLNSTATFMGVRDQFGQSLSSIPLDLTLTYFRSEDAFVNLSGFFLGGTGSGTASLTSSESMVDPVDIGASWAQQLEFGLYSNGDGTGTAFAFTDAGFSRVENTSLVSGYFLDFELQYSLSGVARISDVLLSGDRAVVSANFALSSSGFGPQTEVFRSSNFAEVAIDGSQGPDPFVFNLTDSVVASVFVGPGTNGFIATFHTLSGEVHSTEKVLVTPEPTTTALLALGLLGMGFARRRTH